jgi:hypothetical protein
MVVKTSENFTKFLVVGEVLGRGRKVNAFLFCVLSVIVILLGVPIVFPNGNPIGNPNGNTNGSLFIF